MAQMQEMEGPPGGIVYDDVELLQCDACLTLVSEAFDAVRKARSARTKIPLREDEIGDLLDDEFCVSKSSKGRWISWYDVVERVRESDGVTTRLDLKKMSGPGKCQNECLTLQEACENVFHLLVTDLVEYLYVGAKSKVEVQNELCRNKRRRNVHKLKGSCTKAYPSVSLDRSNQGENFRLKTEFDLKMDEMNEHIRNDPNLGSLGSLGGEGFNPDDMPPMNSDEL